MSFFNNIRILKWSVVGLLLLNISLVAFIFLRHPKHRPQRPKLHKKLEFNTEQTNAFHDLREAHFQEREQVLNTITTLKKDWYTKGMSQSLDSVTIKEYATKIGEEQARFDILLFNHFQDVGKLCTAEQRELWEKHVLKFISHTGKHKRKRKR